LTAALVSALVLVGCAGSQSGTRGESGKQGADPAVPGPDGMFTDSRDGQRYRAVKIGNLTWMAQNLNFAADNSWCFGDDGSNCDKYGRVYTWDAAMAACPSPWRLAAGDDWNNLIEIAGGKEAAGKQLKSKTGWDFCFDEEDESVSLPCDANGIDGLGFSALPGGLRSRDGTNAGGGVIGAWWTDDEIADGGKARNLGIVSNFDFVDGNYADKNGGVSVRCVLGKLPGPGDDISDAASATAAVLARAAAQEAEEAAREAEAAKSEETFADPRDGQTYRMVKIGSHTWMAQNLNFKTGNSWCYDNNDANCGKYGRLYTWETALTACPDGWHLPSHGEWQALVDFAGGEGAVNKLKSKSGWSEDGNGTDEYGFSALPGGSGYSSGDAGGDFSHAGNNGDWWSATEVSRYDAWRRYMIYNYGNVGMSHRGKPYLLSVRCMK